MLSSSFALPGPIIACAWLKLARWPLRLSRWEAPSDLGEVVRAVFEPPDHRSLVGRPDIVARFEVRGCVRPFHGDAGLAERGEVVRIWDVVPKIVAHRCSPPFAVAALPVPLARLASAIPPA